MNRFITLLLILFINITTAQINQNKIASIEYQLNISTYDQFQRTVLLKCSNTESVSKTLANNSKAGINSKEVSAIITEKQIDEYQSIDLIKNTLYSIDNIKEKSYLIKEEIPEMNWKLDSKNETKKINSFICSKATLHFRGRNYVAWYSPYIPLPFGPWKFHGLPGLILEISDIKNNYLWSVTKITYPSTTNLDTDVFKQQAIKEVSLRQFVDAIQTQKQAMFARIMAAMPRGTTMDEGEDVRTSIEMVYDWETKK